MSSKVLELEKVLKDHGLDESDFTLEVGAGGSVLSKEKQKDLLDAEVQTDELKVEELPVAARPEPERLERVPPVFVRLKIEAYEDEPGSSSNEEIQDLQDQITKLDQLREADLQEMQRLLSDNTRLVDQIEQLQQKQHSDQGSNLEQSQRMDSQAPGVNGEFITDITKEARYKDLET